MSVNRNNFITVVMCIMYIVIMIGQVECRCAYVDNTLLLNKALRSHVSLHNALIPLCDDGSLVQLRTRKTSGDLLECGIARRMRSVSIISIFELSI